jgi:AcrR family transcriptional regulator
MSWHDMSARTSSRCERALPRGLYAVDPAVVAADQRRRLLAALPVVIAEAGFDGATVANIVRRAGVSPGVFYEQFADKRECFAVAYEIAQERLLGAITFQCYTRTGVAERIKGALSAALELLDAEPALARLLVLEAPVAGAELVARHHAWLDRYGRMLRFAAVGKEDVMMPSPSIEPAIVGGIASRIKESLLTGDTRPLPDLLPELSAFAASFYGTVQPSFVRELYESEQPQFPPGRPAAEPAVPA